MTIKQLDKKLDILLRKYIKDRKHILTGALYKSVLFNCVLNSNGNIDIKFSSMYYIKFLEHGDFVNDFYNLSSVNEVIRDFIVSNAEASF